MTLEAWQGEFLDVGLQTTFLNKPTGQVGHHVLLDSLATDTVEEDVQRIFSELGSRTNPATGRPYYDLGNNSDNMIGLLGSQGGATNVNGALVHSSNHPEYSAFIREKVAPDIVAAYTDVRLAGGSHAEALTAAGNRA